MPFTRQDAERACNALRYTTRRLSSEQRGALVKIIVAAKDPNIARCARELVEELSADEKEALVETIVASRDPWSAFKALRDINDLSVAERKKLRDASVLA
jgi:hypothetical protein